VNNSRSNHRCGCQAWANFHVAGLQVCFTRATQHQPDPDALRSHNKHKTVVLQSSSHNKLVDLSMWQAVSWQLTKKPLAASCCACTISHHTQCAVVSPDHQHPLLSHSPINKHPCMQSSTAHLHSPSIGSSSQARPQQKQAQNHPSLLQQAGVCVHHQNLQQHAVNTHMLAQLLLPVSSMTALLFFAS
jgi:hypothetical protein